MTPKVTWLTPAADAWERVMGKGTFPFGQGAKYLKPLTEHHEPETIGLHLAEYLRRQKPEFVALSRFAMTFGQWAPKKLSLPQDDLPLVDDHGVLLRA